MLGQKLVFAGLAPEEREAAGIAHRHGQSGVDEALPVVRIYQDVAHLASTLDGGHAPVEPNPLALLPLVLAERDARRADVATVARHDEPRVGALAAELVDHVRGLAPVGVDQAALDPQLGPVVAPPAFGQVRIGQILQTGVDRAFKPRARRGAGERLLHLAQGEDGTLLVGIGATISLRCLP